MKMNRFAAVGATVALTVGSIVGIGAAAFGVEVPIDDIGQESAGHRTRSSSGSSATPPVPALTQDDTGLTIPGRNQLLYGRSIETSPVTEFSVSSTARRSMATGPLTFQVAGFLDGDRRRTSSPPFARTTRFAVDERRVDLQLGPSRRAPLENAPVPFSTIVAAFEPPADSTRSSPSVCSPEPATTACFSSVTWDGTTWTFATPEVVVTPPTPVTPPAVVPAPIKDPATFTG